MWIYVVIVLSIAVFIFIAKAIIIVKQSEVLIIERFGNYHITLMPGLKFIIPIYEKPRATYWVTNGITVFTNRLDMRETVLDIPEQAVITQDNVSIEIDAIMYVQITDPKKSLYEVANLPLAISQLAQTTLRSLIGEMELDSTLSSRDYINNKLKLVLDEATDKWGLKVNRVELRNISPPRDIQEAMEKQMQAERTRRALVLEAQGDKEARIARSEGQKQENINLAVGDKEALIKRAEGEANAILAIASAQAKAIQEIVEKLGTSEAAAQYLIATNYLEKFGDFTQEKGDKIFIPYEATSILSSLGSIKEIFNKS